MGASRVKIYCGQIFISYVITRRVYLKMTLLAIPDKQANHGTNVVSLHSLLFKFQINKRIMVQMLSVFTLFIVCTVPSRIVTITMDMVHFESHDMLLGFQVHITFSVYSFLFFLPSKYSIPIRPGF